LYGDFPQQETKLVKPMGVGSLEQWGAWPPLDFHTWYRLSR